jgi:hypothetical protein
VSECVCVCVCREVLGSRTVGPDLESVLDVAATVVKSVISGSLKTPISKAV